MSEARTEVKLGEVFATTSERIGSRESEPRVFSISKHGGVVPADEYHGRRIASDKLDAYKSLPSNGWAYSTIHIDEGSIARNHHDYEGAVSPMYTTFRWTSDVHDPDFFELLLKSPEMLGRYKDSAQGSINRRRSLPWSTFSTMSVFVPPLPEQLRIVDLIGALDEAIEAADERTARANSALAAALAGLYESLESDVTSATSLMSYMIGGSWGEAPLAAECPTNALGPSAFSGSVTDVDPSRGSARSLSAKKLAARALTEGDIIIERSGGSPTQPVGRVIRATSDLSNTVHSDFMRLVRVDPEKADPRFVFWVLRMRYSRGDTVEFQKQTTNIRNLNITDYLDSPFRLPRESEEQRAFADLGESFSSAIVEGQEYTKSLRTLRSNVLAALLSGEHEIPSSYDEHLGVVE